MRLLFAEVCKQDSYTAGNVQLLYYSICVSRMCCLIMVLGHRHCACLQNVLGDQGKGRPTQCTRHRSKKNKQ